MLKRIVIICLIGLIFSAFIPLSIYIWNGKTVQDLRIRNGVLDLSSWDYEQHGRINLDGDWEFYWHKLLSPDDFAPMGKDKPVYDALMEVPSTWNGKRVNGVTLPAYGFATYRAVLKNLPHGGIFALKKTNIRFSSTVYVNGQKLFDDGKPSGRPETYKAGNIPQMGYFAAGPEDVEIIVQVANYDYVNAGIPVSLYFGEQAAMVQHQKKALALEFSTLAALGILALIYFICYVAAALYRRKDNLVLWSAAICLLFVVYHGLIGERPLLLFLPGVSFETIYKIKDMSAITCFILLACFFYKSQKSLTSLKLIQAVIALLACDLVLIAILPIGGYTPLQPYVMVVYEFLLIWLLWEFAVIFIKSKRSERFNSLLLFMAILTINLYSLDTILFALSLKESLWLEQLYILIFNVIMVFLVVQKFFEAYHTVNEMKNDLIRLDEIKDDFLSDTSQRLTAPLNNIVTIADSLLKGAEGPVSDSQALNLNVVISSGRRLTFIVNELLDYSKIKHGDIKLFKTRIHLKDAVDSVIRVHMFLLSGRQIRLVNKVPDKWPAVYADSNRLIQILHNLLGYAIKASERGIVEVNGEILRNQIRITVRSSGAGMAEDMIDRLFQSLEDREDSAENPYGGTVLGLSITKKLVELHGGTISARSAPGKGMALHFTLPLADSFSENTDKAINASLATGFAFSHSNEPANGRKEAPLSAEYPIYVPGTSDETILVVENDLANLQAMSNLLKLEGYSAVFVNRGQQALEEIAAGKSFSLVILNITLPDMSGYEVLIRIRERFSPFELPVLMLTPRNRVKDMKLSVENGANDFVGMPFESEELLARVRSLTELKASVKNAKDAEIAFLRSQINPHFLYNALNSIAELCVQAPGQAEELTLELSRYLRGSFDFKQLVSLSTLGNELELLAAYVHIEKARFGERLEVEYEVDAEPSLQIPPLILQPLVENAIRHGLMSHLQGGKVKISVKKTSESGIHFSVEDDGRGMSERKLKDVLSKDRYQKGVGLWNISQRLKLLYGRGISIESAEGIGTKVSFDIPGQTTVTDGRKRHAADDDRGR
ncbi:ATP-binding protein [Paenibacillus sp. TH7-28]